MQRLTLVTAAAFATMTLATDASATAPSWFWSTSKASRLIVAINPQAFHFRNTPNHTTIQTARCSGFGTPRVDQGVKKFEVFICAALVRDDARSSLFRSTFAFETSAKSPLNIDCAADTPVTMAQLGCLRPSAHTSVVPPDPAWRHWDLKTAWNPTGSIWFCQLPGFRPVNCGIAATQRLIGPTLIKYLVAQTHLPVTQYNQHGWIPPACIRSGFTLFNCSWKIVVYGAGNVAGATWAGGQFTIQWQKNVNHYEPHFAISGVPTCTDDPADKLYGCPGPAPAGIGTFRGTTAQGYSITLTASPSSGAVSVAASWHYRVACSLYASGYYEQDVRAGASGTPSNGTVVIHGLSDNGGQVAEINAAYSSNSNSWTGTVRGALHTTNPSIPLACDTSQVSFTASPG